MPSYVNAPVGVNTNTVGVGAAYDEAGEALISTFGPTPTLTNILRDHQGRGELITSSTLASAVAHHERFSSTQTAALKVVVERQFGWHTVFAPLEKTDKLSLTYNREIANRFTLDRVPESVAPRFVSSRSESRTFNLVHHNLGARFHHEFYKTPEGRKQAQQRQQIILVAAIVACKLTVSATIVKAQMYYRKMERRSGVRHKSVSDAQANEVSLFGVFNKDARAIYKIAQYIDETVQRLAAGGQGDLAPLTNYVVGSGLLNQITVSNKAETEVSRREPEIASRMLSLGARALPSVLPGRTVYEDPAWALDNVPAEELHVFRRVAIIGQYYMIDGSRVGASGAVPNIKDELSIKVPDADRNDYARYGIEDALRHSMRYAPNGELSHKHEEFRLALPAFSQKLGLVLENSRAVDPYIWLASDALQTKEIRSDNYRVVEYYGDMDYLFWSKDQMFQHARAAAASIRETSQMNTTFATALREFRALIKDLYTLPASMSESERRALLVYVYVTNLINFDTASGDIKPNIYGGIKLPTIVPITNATGVTRFFYGDDNGNVYTVGKDTSKVVVTGHAIAGVADIFDADTAVSVNLPNKFARPWGFAGLHHFRTLAELLGKSGYEGYDQTYFERARALVPVLDTYLETLKRVYPHSELWSPLYVPSYASSSNSRSEYNSLNSVACNVLDRVRHPLWFKFPAAAATTTSPIALDNSRLVQLIKFVFGAGDPNTLRDVITFMSAPTSSTPAQTFLKAAVDAAFAQVITSTNITAARNTLKSEVAKLAAPTTTIAAILKVALEGTVTVFDVFATAVAIVIEQLVKNYGFRTELAFLKGLNETDYSDLVFRWNNHQKLGQAMAESDPGKHQGFETFLIIPWQQWIAATIDGAADVKVFEKAGVHMFAALSNTLNALNKNYQNINIRLTMQTITQLATTAEMVPSATAYTLRGDESALRKRARNDVVEVLDAWSYINSRLLFHPDVYRILNIATAAGVYALGTMIFAENPDTGVPMTVNSAYTTKESREDAVTSNARVGFARDPVGINNMVFGNPAVTLGADANKRRRTNYESSLSSAIVTASEDASRYTIGSNFDTRDDSYLGISVRNNIAGPLYSITQTSTTATITERHNLIARTSAFSSESPDDETRIAGILAVFSRVHRNTLEVWLDFNLPIPDSCYIVAQPFIRLETEAMVAFANGAGTLYYAHEDVSNQLSNDSKQWTLHYTIWLGCAIPDESKVMVLPDVRIIGYQGGLDLQVYDDEDSFDAQSLDFKRSTFVFSCGSTFSRDLALKHANPLSLFGKFDANQFAYAFENEGRIFTQTPQWPAALFYAFLWKFNNMNHASTVDTNFQSLTETPEVTGLLYMGRHLAWSTGLRDHVLAIRGTGHLGNIDPPFNQVFSSGITFDSSK